MINSRRPVQLLLTGSLAGILALTGCGSDDDSSSEASTPASTSSSAGEDGAGPDEGADASGDETCAQLTELDATALTFGPVQAFLPKEGLAGEIEARLTPMTSVTPPADLADAWGAWQGFLEEQAAATEQLPAGGRLDDPALIQAPADVQAAQETLSDWWFDTCV